MIELLLAAAALGAPFADDIPAGTDVAIRLGVAELTKAGKPVADEAEGLASAWPGLSLRLGGWRADLVALADAVSAATGADFTRKGTTATLLVDVDAVGGPVTAALVRGALVGKGSAEGELTLTLASPELAAALPKPLRFARLDEALVIGDERGVQRLTAQLAGSGRSTRDDALVTLARALRREAPLMAAATVLPPVRKLLLTPLSPHLQPLATPLAAVTLVADARAIELRARAKSDEGRTALTHLCEAGAASLRAMVATLDAAAEVAAGLQELGKDIGGFPPEDFDAERAGALVDDALRAFRATLTVRARERHALEARLELSDYRGLVAALLFAIGRATPKPPPSLAEIKERAEAVLEELLELELAHKEKHGRFLACAPWPKTLPKEGQSLRPDACFASLGFTVEGEQLFQLAATLDGGRLVLLARADANRDGTPEVFYLDENGEEVRVLGGKGEGTAGTAPTPADTAPSESAAAAGGPPALTAP